MKLYSRIYRHFYNDMARSFINLINEYGIKETDSLSVLNIKDIIKLYDTNEVVLEKIWYHNITIKYDNDINATQSIIEMSTTDGKTFNLFTLPIDQLIQTYELVILYILCAEYNIKTATRYDIIDMFDKTIDKEMKGEISFFNNGESNKTVQELSSTIEELILASKASTGSLQDLIKKENDIDSYSDDIEDAEYLKRAYNAIVTLSKNENNEYNLNVNIYNLKLNFDILVSKMTEYEMISIYDLIRNNDKINKQTF